MAKLTSDCDDFIMAYCGFISADLRGLVRNSESLIQSMAHEVSYLKLKRLMDSLTAPQIADELIAEFRCWEVRPEFLEAFKPAEVKRVRQCRETTA
jgi:hypothetical protein